VIETIGKHLQATARTALNDHYVRLFSQLPTPKDEVCNMVVFSAIYIIHHEIYCLFPDFREQFDLR
jgi:hypothetical protein